MQLLGQNYQCNVEGEQISQSANGGRVRFYSYPRQHPGKTICDWVQRWQCCEIWYKIGDGNWIQETYTKPETGEVILVKAWASPKVFSDRTYNVGSRWFVNDTHHEYSSEFYNYDDWRTSDTWTTEFDVSISRGNARQASKTVTYQLRDRGYWNGIQKTWGGTPDNGRTWVDGTITTQLTVYTSKIADVSNISFSVTVDGPTVRDRYIHIRASFTNPESYYTGKVSGYNDTITSSFSKDIPVTTNMFNTDKSYTFIITGKDKTQYKNITKTVHIEPSGVGVWWKNNSGKIKEVQEVWYKDNGGNIRNVTEGWYKKSGQTILRTTK